MKDHQFGEMEFEVIKAAAFCTEQVIETAASDVGKSQFISLRDACTCTGNCNGNYYS